MPNVSFAKVPSAAAVRDRDFVGDGRDGPGPSPCAAPCTGSRPRSAQTAENDEAWAFLSHGMSLKASQREGLGLRTFLPVLVLVLVLVAVLVPSRLARSAVPRPRPRPQAIPLNRSSPKQTEARTRASWAIGDEGDGDDTNRDGDEDEDEDEDGRGLAPWRQAPSTTPVPAPAPGAALRRMPLHHQVEPGQAEDHQRRHQPEAALGAPARFLEVSEADGKKPPSAPKGVPTRPPVRAHVVGEVLRYVLVDRRLPEAHPDAEDLDEQKEGPRSEATGGEQSAKRRQRASPRTRRVGDGAGAEPVGEPSAHRTEQAGGEDEQGGQQRRLRQRQWKTFL